MKRLVKALAVIVAINALLVAALTLSWAPTSLYGGPANDQPLPVSQIITFAPLTSTPFYSALDASMKQFGCTQPQGWAARYGSAYPVTMIVQLADSSGQPTWHLAAKAWSFSNIGGFVRLLCPQLPKARMQ